MKAPRFPDNQTDYGIEPEQSREPALPSMIEQVFSADWTDAAILPSA